MTTLRSTENATSIVRVHEYMFTVYNALNNRSQIIARVGKSHKSQQITKV